MPAAPARRHACTASSTFGSRPPREFRRVATLLTFTERRIMCVTLPEIAEDAEEADQNGGTENRRRTGQHAFSVAGAATRRDSEGRRARTSQASAPLRLVLARRSSLSR